MTSDVQEQYKLLVTRGQGVDTLYLNDKFNPYYESDKIRRE
jgi:hypothetical protein